MVTKPQRQDSSRARKDKLLSCPYPRSLTGGGGGKWGQLGFLSQDGVEAGRRGGCLPVQWASYKLPNVAPYFTLLCLCSHYSLPWNALPSIVSLGPSQLSFVPYFLPADPSRLNQSVPLLVTQTPLSRTSQVCLAHLRAWGGGGV